MKAVLFMVVTVAVLGGLFVFFKPAPVAVEPLAAAPAPAQQPKASPAASAKPQMLPVEVPAAEREPDPFEYDLVVKAGKLVSGSGAMKARQGDDITLRITSDVADDVHVHGYDRHAHLKAGETATLRIKATRTGRFPLELHKSRLELGSLEIYPR